MPHKHHLLRSYLASVKVPYKKFFQILWDFESKIYNPYFATLMPRVYKGILYSRLNEEKNIFWENVDETRWIQPRKKIKFGVKKTRNGEENQKIDLEKMKKIAEVFWGAEGS